MTKASHLPISLSLLILLASCGGGSGVSSDPVSAGTPNSQAPIPAAPQTTISSIFGAQGSGAITVPQITSATAHLDSLFEAANSGQVSIVRPDLAEVTLNGLIGNNSELGMTIGRLTLDADLVSNTISGSATDFTIFDTETADVSQRVEDLSGSLGLSNGVISGASINADLTGQLSGQNTISYDAELDGSFIDVQGIVHGIGRVTGTSQIGTQDPVALEEGTFLVSE